MAKLVSITGTGWVPKLAEVVFPIAPSGKKKKKKGFGSLIPAFSMTESVKDQCK